MDLSLKEVRAERQFVINIGPMDSPRNVTEKFLPRVTVKNIKKHII